MHQRIAACERVSVLRDRVETKAEISNADAYTSDCRKRLLRGEKRRAPMSRVPEPVSNRIAV